ncbi:MAG: hypothetical protein SGJ24_20295 [Chloroflexota bacterium]|nr:hypothetical protein [Chloroflexota bacterium]
MLSLSFIFSAITTLISGVFAVFVLRRWYEAKRTGKGRPHLLAWGIGLVLYCLGAFSQTVLALTWNETFYALWYWSGAIAVAPWLGQGTIYLLMRRGSAARNIQMALILICVMTLPWALFLTPLDGSAWFPGADMAGLTNQVMQRGGVRGFVPVMNIWGTVALVGGAIYSAMLFRRKQILRGRMIGNWLIALGGLLPALGGALIRLDLTWLKYPGEMFGVIVIFAGFLIAAGAADEVRAAPRHTSSAEGTA